MIDITQALPLLGGLSPQQFMHRHWQKKPLLVRQAIPQFKAPLGRAALFALAAREDVESRLVQHTEQGWQLRSGPLSRRMLPALTQREWTLLVQGVDALEPAVHRLQQQFRFIPDARLDDVMISYASDGGGVGPHFDSYDVFLLQAHGRRRWRIGRQTDLSLQEGLQLKVLANFVPEEEFVLEPGDMLYLPPRYAHDGVAQGECMTYSVGFRAPQRGELGRELLLRLADSANDAVEDGAEPVLYRDARQAAVAEPAALPPALLEFARDALERALQDPQALARSLGEYLSEPKANVWFEASAVPAALQQVSLARSSRMLYDAQHVFINGEAFRASGRDAQLMRQLANQRSLGAAELARASAGALELLRSWCEDGWLHADVAAGV